MQEARPPPYSPDYHLTNGAAAAAAGAAGDDDERATTYPSAPPPYLRGRPPPYPDPNRSGGVAGFYPQYPLAYRGSYPQDGDCYGGGAAQPAHQFIVIDRIHPLVIEELEPAEDYCEQKALACLTFWFCNFVFGLIAYLLATSAEDTYHHDPAAARRLGNASVGVSIAGILTTVVIVTVFVIFQVAEVDFASSSPCAYLRSGSCFCCRSYSYSGFMCDIEHSGTTYFDYATSTCYHN